MKELPAQDGAGVQEWRVKNISPRYYVARVRRFAFLLPKAPRSRDNEQACAGESFGTRAFNSETEALHWVSGAGAI